MNAVTFIGPIARFSNADGSDAIAAEDVERLRVTGAAPEKERARLAENQARLLSRWDSAKGEFGWERWLAEVQEQLTGKNALKVFQDAVALIQRQNDISFEDAWNKAKTQFKTLFKNMTASSSQDSMPATLPTLANESDRVNAFHQAVKQVIKEKHLPPSAYQWAAGVALKRNPALASAMQSPRIISGW